MPCTLLPPSAPTFRFTIKELPQNMTYNDHLAPSMLWERQHCKKTNKNKQKIKPQENGGGGNRSSIKKKVFCILNKIENILFSKCENMASDNTRPPPEKITHTQRYSIHNTAEHALPNDSIRQYRRSNGISLLECFCAKF